MFTNQPTTGHFPFFASKQAVCWLERAKGGEGRRVQVGGEQELLTTRHDGRFYIFGKALKIHGTPVYIRHQLAR